MKKTIAGLLLAMCLVILGYVYIHNTFNPEKSVSAPSKLENCQNLKIDDLKLITFANKCLLEYGKNRSAYTAARNISDVTCPRNISDFTPPEIKRFSKSDIQKLYKSRNEKIPEIKFPDEWTVWYHNKKGYMGGDYVVKISPVTCECSVDGVP